MSDDVLKQNQPVEIDPNDPLGSVDEMASQEVPAGVDRRAFLMRSALIGATAVMLDRPGRPNRKRTGWRQRRPR